MKKMLTGTDPGFGGLDIPDEPTDLSSIRIPGYDLIRIAGEGGMGVVYEAWQQSTNRKVAIKMMKGSRVGSERLRQRFEREVGIAASLSHPRIVRVYESGLSKSEGILFFTMELIDGKNLDKWMIERAPDQRTVLGIFLKICEALQHAHQKTVIHRDLKPGNILVDSNGNPTLLDFGLGKALDSDDEQLSQTGDKAGTPDYMSPEQASGEMTTDTRSDIYSLGVMLFQALTGQLPFEKADRKKDPKRARSVKPDLSRDLEAILDKALKNDPAQRYQSVDQLAGDIRNFLESRPVSAKPLTAMYLMQRGLYRHRVPAAVALVVLAVATAGIITYIININAYSKASEVARIKAENRQKRAEDLLGFMVLEATQSLLDGEQYDLVLRFIEKADEHQADIPDEEMTPIMQQIQVVSEGVRGNFLAQQWNLEEAEKAFQSALALSEKVSPEIKELPTFLADKAVSNSKLGTTLINMGKPEEAAPYLENSIALWDRVLTSTNLSRQVIVNYTKKQNTVFRAMGRVREQLTRHDQAYPFYERAAASLRELANVDGQYIPAWSQALEDFANCASILGRHEEAINNLTQAVRAREIIVEKVPGLAAGHHNLAVCHGKLGQAYQRQGDMEKALNSALLGHKIYSNYLQNGGPHHPAGIHDYMFLGIFNEMAGTMIEAEKHDYAAQLYLENIRIDERLRIREGDKFDAARHLELTDRRLRFLRARMVTDIRESVDDQIQKAAGELNKLKNAGTPLDGLDQRIQELEMIAGRSMDKLISESSKDN